MGLITTTIKIIPTNRNYKRYKELGYNFNLGEEIEINISDLPVGSNKKVECSCDYCGEIINMTYSNYNTIMKKPISKIACLKCTSQKRKESNLLIYGVDTPSKLDYIKDKTKNTCLEKYGTTCVFSNPEIQEKIKNTNLKKYGVENVFEDEEIKRKIKETNLKKYGVENPAQNPEIIVKMQQTMLDLYGVSNPMFLEVNKEKIKNTNLQKYGFESATQTEETKQKMKKTSLERYGVEYYSQSEECKEKIKNTIINKYGVENVMNISEIAEKRCNTMIKKYGNAFPQQIPEIKEKIKETNIIKYGVPCVLQSEEIKNKIIATNMKRYGFKNPMNCSEIQRKVALTFSENQTVNTSRQQKYIHNLFGGELNGVVSHFNCDIVFREEKIVWEIDFGGHDLPVKIGEISQKEFELKQIKRDKLIKSEGYRIVRIISRKDYLPSDTILLQMLQYARDFFAQNPKRTWLSFDIDNSCIYNAYHKKTDVDNIQYYNYGKLHKLNRNIKALI